MELHSAELRSMELRSNPNLHSHNTLFWLKKVVEKGFYRNDCVRLIHLSLLLKSRYVSFLGLGFLKKLFTAVTVTLWKSDNPVSITVEFQKLFYLLIRIRSIHVVLSGFLKCVGFLIRLLKLQDPQKLSTK